MDTNSVWKIYKGGMIMLIRDRISAREYPLNLAYEIVMYDCKELKGFPDDIDGSIEYVLHTALKEKQRKVLQMHWRDKMTLEKIGVELGGMAKQTVQEIEKKSLRILRDPKWAKFVLIGVQGAIDAEKYRTENIKKRNEERDKQYEEDPLKIPLFDLEFSVRIYNALRRAGVENAGDIKDKMEEI